MTRPICILPELSKVARSDSKRTGPAKVKRIASALIREFADKYVSGQFSVIFVSVSLLFPYADL